jgi:hypothetical protein
MDLFQNKPLPVDKVMQLRTQGLTDNLIVEELKNQGFTPEQASQAISQADSSGGGMSGMNMSQSEPQQQQQQQQQPHSDEEGNIYERIEQITEGIIDEKWDALISEVKKIIAWKEKIEEKQTQMQNDLTKLKEDFKVLHQGVLGKLEDYDKRMQDVGVELNAVGKVFKDVVPEFVENVKELRAFNKERKEKEE